MHILLVEDSPSDIRLTEEALKDSGFPYSLRTVTDGEAALDLLMKSENDKSKVPDLILLDLNMPKKNGHEVLEGMKLAPWLDPVPVILMTVSQDEQDILKALHLKMNYYVCKPVTSEKLNVLLKAIHDLNESAPRLREGGLTGEDAHVRYVMAGNPHTMPEILARLAEEPSAHIRTSVAENPRTPEATLLNLAKDENPEVRLAVAENPNLPVSVLEQLITDAHDDVRFELASNPKLPVHILQKLSFDENLFIVDRANKTLQSLVPSS